MRNHLGGGSRALVVLVFTLSAAVTGWNVPAHAATPTPGAARYQVSLTADDTGTIWHGRESVTFSNTGAWPLDDVWFRLWANGHGRCADPAITITDTAGGAWADPVVGCTAVRVDLSHALQPGSDATVSFRFTLQVPKRDGRFGNADGVSLLGNALPILAVHDGGGWHLDPYVGFADSFYSLASSFRVTVDTPNALDVAATGAQVQRSTANGRTIRTFVARHVRDFALAASSFSRASRVVDGVPVRVWYRPDVIAATTARWVDRLAARSLATFQKAFGAYPARELDVVLTRLPNEGGMEYPGIVFVSPSFDAVAHEVAHQWWYASVGNDEYGAPWLDESFATWSQTLPFDPWIRCDRYDWPSSSVRLTDGVDYFRRHPYRYGVIYSGGGCMLANLAGRFGLGRFETILRDYAHDHRNGVTDGASFRAAVTRAGARYLPGFDAPAFWRRWRVT